MTTKIDACEKMSINKFKFKDFPRNSAIVLIAKRGSGKSYIVREIIEHYKDIPVGAIICPSEADSPFYSKFYPECYIHFKYNPKILENIFKRQKIILEKYNKHLKKGETIDPRCIIIMDDCMASKKIWVNDELIKTVLMNGRHKSMTYVLTMQYPLGVTPELRSNFDVVFVLAIDEIKVIKLVHENFAGIFETLDGFRKVLKELTQDYGAMVLVKRGAAAEFTDKVKWYKAAERDDSEYNDIKIGSKQFRKFNHLNYNESWKKNNDIDLDEFFLRGTKKDFNAVFKNAKKDKADIKVNKGD